MPAAIQAMSLVTEADTPTEPAAMARQIKDLKRSTAAINLEKGRILTKIDREERRNREKAAA